MKLKRWWFLLAVPILMTSACAGGPSNSEIEKAVRASLERGVPVEMQGNLLGGVEPWIDDMKIVAVGEKQGTEEKPWYPVKVWAKGHSYTAFGKGNEFEGEAEYRVQKDPYGEWKAEPTGPAPVGQELQSIVPRRPAPGRKDSGEPLQGASPGGSEPGGDEASDLDRQKRTMADQRSIGTAVESYSIDNNAYPTASGMEELSEFIQPIYLRTPATKDGWGRPFVVESTEKHYLIISLGKDGKRDESVTPGSFTDPNRDIVFQDGQFVAWPEGAQQ
jgi:hypothetical protein